MKITKDNVDIVAAALTRYAKELSEYLRDVMVELTDLIYPEAK